MRIRRLWLVLLVLLIPTAAGAHGHTADLYGAISFAHASKLWGFHETYGLTVPHLTEKRLTLVGDLSLHVGSHEGDDTTRATFMGGVRWTFANSTTQKHLPSVHVLAGGVHNNAAQVENDPALAVGGSWEYLPHGDRSLMGWGVRLQGDYVVSGGDSFPRFSGGVVYRFKKESP